MLSHIVLDLVTVDYSHCTSSLTLANIVLAFFFIIKRLGNSWIVRQLFEYRVDNSLTTLLANLANDLLWPLRVIFFNDVDIEVVVDHLLNDFRGNNIVLLFFPCLRSSDKVNIRSIYYIPDFFFIEYDLCKIGWLRPVLKAMELLFLVFAVIIFVYHYSGIRK